MWLEVKKNICSYSFWGGVVVLLLAALLVGYPFAEQLADSGYSSEGTPWYVSYVYCTTTEKFLFFIPLLAPFAASRNAEMEIRSRFYIFSCSRMGKRQYLLTQSISVALSGGLLVVCACVMLIPGLLIWSGNAEIAGEATQSGAIAVGIFSCLLTGFLNGAFWSLVGAFLAVFLRNYYSAWGAPFVIYYVLVIFQERYYPSFFFLSPRYWAAPGYYSPYFGICILCVLSLLMGSLFFAAIKRRMDYAGT